MGLAERRITMDFQQNVFPGLKKQIDEAAGFEVPVEVDWENIAEPEKSQFYKDFWPAVYFEPLIHALRSLCADDLGKQAVKASLKKVEITDSRSKDLREGISFENGVLRIDQRVVNKEDWDVRRDTILARVGEAL